MGLTEIQEFNDIIFENFLAHYGVGWDENPPGIGSGRYPHGSGENPGQHDLSLAKKVSDMKKKGITESDIAKGLGYKSTFDLRAAVSIDSTNRRKDLRDKVPMLKKDGLSTKQISSMLGISESSVRNYLNPDHTEKVDRLTNVTNLLKEQLKDKHYIDVGPGVEIGNEIGSQERLKTAIEVLKKEGYKEYLIKEPQLGNPGQFTTIKVLGDPSTDRASLNKDHTLIKTIENYKVDTTDDKYAPLGVLRPKSIDSSRVYINYTQPDGSGGAEKDGLIELRRGVEDISLGKSMYSQVRIAVDDTHYMKGMALYSDNVPDGYDVIYNTNKKVGTDKYSVYKPMKTIDGKEGSPIDWGNPFGAAIKKENGQAYCLDKNGNPTKELRVINKVNDQGDWGEWKKQISAQVLGKQPLPLIKRQLELTYQDKRTEFDEIMALTNPTIKRKLLESFASDCDASAVHLKAKSFPGQASHAIIPIISLEGGTEEYKKKHGVDGEIYAPNYEHGSVVALFRYPHAGTFETPILRVNNRNKEAISVMKNAPDAVGINSKIAERLSGADFDGDTVTVIPTTHTNILSTPALKGLVGFNTKDYKFADPNAKGISSQGKQNEMGKTTNLIADMQYKGATEDEICRAVKHSMVVIDSEKHHLDYKRSEAENGIAELKRKYQNGGASTLITRAGSPKYVPQTKLASIIGPDGKKHYGINPDTGEFITIVDTNATAWKKGNPKKGEPEWIQKQRQTKSTKMAEAKTPEDVYNLMSSRDNPHPAELAYANFAIKMKELANEARKAQVNTPKLKRDPQAAKEYADEVQSLSAHLAVALKHAPVERQAQIIGNAEYKMRIEANPGLDKEHQKRLKGQCLNGARLALGGGKTRIPISDREWEAIQKGAISDTMLMNILNNTDTDAVKKRATPRANKELDASKKALAKSWAALGYNQQEIANRLGVSTSTISRIINS